MEITETTATYPMNLVGSRTGETYIGEFKFKCLLTPIEKIEADKQYRKLLGENMIMASDTAKSLAFALSQLQFRILEAPPFWDSRVLGGSHIMDDNIIIEAFNKSVEAEEQFMEAVQKKAKEIEERLQKAIKSKQIEKEEEVESPND